MDLASNDKVTESNGAAFWLPLFVVCIAQIGTSGDNSVLSMSTNEFITKLGASMDQVQLANIVYSLLAGALMVFGGMLGIAKGLKKVFILGAILCAAGETLAAIAPNMNILVWGARSLTGFGAALMIPSVLGIIVSLYEGKQRAVAFGAVGAATGIASIIMPIGEGIIIDVAGYQAAFFTMAAWFTFVLVAALKCIPNIEAAKMRVDYSGTVLASIGLMLFIVGCSKVAVWGLIAPLEAPFTVLGISPALPLVALGIIVLVFTLAIEKKIEAKYDAALIPQSFVKTPQVRSGLYVTGLIFLVFGGVMFVALSWIMVVAGKSGAESGIAIAVMAVPLIICSLIIPKRFSHISPKFIVQLSTIANCIGAVSMAMSLQADGFNTVLMYTGMLLMGAGQGGYASQSAMIVSTALSQRDAAQSGGIQCSTRNVWQACGVAIIGSVLLFSSTLLFKADIGNSEVSPVIKEYVAQTPVHGFMSNQQMLDNLQATGATHPEATKALSIYKDVRIQSAQYAFWALIFLILLHIPGFNSIPAKGWTEE